MCKVEIKSKVGDEQSQTGPENMHLSIDWLKNERSEWQKDC